MVRRRGATARRRDEEEQGLMRNVFAPATIFFLSLLQQVSSLTWSSSTRVCSGSMNTVWRQCVGGASGDVDKYWGCNGVWRSSVLPSFSWSLAAFSSSSSSSSPSSLSSSSSLPMPRALRMLRYTKSVLIWPNHAVVFFFLFWGGDWQLSLRGGKQYNECNIITINNNNSNNNNGNKTNNNDDNNNCINMYKHTLDSPGYWERGIWRRTRRRIRGVELISPRGTPSGRLSNPHPGNKIANLILISNQHPGNTIANLILISNQHPWNRQGKSNLPIRIMVYYSSSMKVS